MSNYKHGMRHHRVWSVWSSMLSRATNPNNHAFKNYGGRGIGVSESWKDFRNFYRDMGDPPEGMTLDRIKNEIGYCKENCRWATYSDQNRNKRNTRLIEIDGVTRPMVEWSEIYGINLKTIWYRLSVGWDEKKAVTKPTFLMRRAGNLGVEFTAPPSKEYQP